MEFATAIINLVIGLLPLATKAATAKGEQLEAVKKECAEHVTSFLTVVGLMPSVLAENDAAAARALKDAFEGEGQ